MKEIEDTNAHELEELVLLKCPYSQSNLYIQSVSVKIANIFHKSEQS